MSDEQAVVTTPDPQGTPAGEGANAQNDVDALLSEYANSGEPKDPIKPDVKTGAKTEAPKGDVISNDEVLGFIRSIKADRDRENTERANAEFEATAKAIKGDIGISDKIVKGWLEQEAKDDPRLLNAYLDRKKNPQKWEKIQTQLTARLRNELTNIPSKSATETANQIESAVRNAKPQTQNPGIPKNLSDLSDADFKKAKKARFAQAKATGR